MTSNLCGWVPELPEKASWTERLSEVATRVGKTSRRVSGIITGVRFRTRMYLSAAVALCGFLYDILRNIDPILALIPILAFAPLVETFFVVYYSRWIENFKLLLGNGIIWQPMPAPFQSLARKLGMKELRFGVKKGLRNAYVHWNRVVFGEALYNELSWGQRRAVFAHELFHKKRRHDLWKMALYGGVSLTTLPYFGLPPVVFAFSFLAYVNLVMVIGNWITESDADLCAAKEVGFGSMADMLLVLNGKDVSEHSETHPSISSRIERLYEKMGRSAVVPIPNDFLH